MIHYFKIHPEPFQEILDLKKFHEVRKDDRAQRPRAGDVVCLQEFSPLKNLATGREVIRFVTYVTEPGTWGLPEDIYVFSHLPAQTHKFCWKST